MEKSGFLLWSKLQGKVRTEDTGNGSRFVSRQVPILNPIMEGRLLMCIIKQASKNYMNLRFKKTEPDPFEADATVYVWFLCQKYWYKSQTYTVASTSAGTGSVYVQGSRLLLGEYNVNVF